MLKFKDDYTTLTATFEDFILLVYTVIDDLYQRSVPVCVSQRRNVHTAKMSDSEIITLSICGELIGIDSEKAWYSFVKRSLLQRAKRDLRSLWRKVKNSLRSLTQRQRSRRLCGRNRVRGLCGKCDPQAL